MSIRPQQLRYNSFGRQLIAATNRKFASAPAVQLPEKGRSPVRGVYAIHRMALTSTLAETPSLQEYSRFPISPGSLEEAIASGEIHSVSAQDFEEHQGATKPLRIKWEEQHGLVLYGQGDDNSFSGIFAKALYKSICKAEGEFAIDKFGGPTLLWNVGFEQISEGHSPYGGVPVYIPGVTGLFQPPVFEAAADLRTDSQPVALLPFDDATDKGVPSVGDIGGEYGLRTLEIPVFDPEDPDTYTGLKALELQTNLDIKAFAQIERPNKIARNDRHRLTLGSSW